MNENLLRRIKMQLNEKFYVMNDAWLRDCIDFFIKDKVPHEITDKRIFEFVEGQWQLSDLREISNETGCLPKNLTQQKYTVLTGNYILQVDKMYDIASSKYKQLSEIRKISSENLEVIDEEKPIEWQPKGRRMMQLCLTDGIQDITAIEYIQIKQMTTALLPGYKVMIIGPINCRRGIILLENGKYREIGGEVESLLKSNATENVLARALGEPENPDPYNDGPSRITNQNIQSVTSNSNHNDSFFDDDFEEAIDLEAVAAIERQSQETVRELSEVVYNHRETNRKDTDEIMEETLQDLDFEPLDNWPSDPAMKSSLMLPSRMETESTDNEDIMIIEKASTLTRNIRNNPFPSTSSYKNENFSEFPDDDFDFDNCDIIVKTKELKRQQDRNILKNKVELCSPSMLKSNCNIPTDVEKCTSTKVAQNEKSMINTLKAVRQISKTKTISNFVEPQSVHKIHVLNDVLREAIVGKIYRIVKAQVKNHSTLTKQGKCWSVTALIADHTSNVEVCFQSEILEKFLGFTVQEFLQKKKLAKSDPRINNELRLSLRKTQHEIQNLDALLKLELVQNQMPKVVDIIQSTM